MAFQEMSDDFWRQVEPLLEPFKRRKSGGRTPLEFRVIFNGILYLLKTGCQWNCLPTCYGAKSTVHEHFQAWAHAGVMTDLFRLFAQKYQLQNGIQWTWQSMDGALVQAPVRGNPCAWRRRDSDVTQPIGGAAVANSTSKSTSRALRWAWW